MYSSPRKGGDGPSQIDVYFARSTDGGVSFAPALLLNDTTSNTWGQTDPSIGVDGEGAVHVVYTNGPQYLLGLASSRDTGRSFAHERGIPGSIGGLDASVFVAPGGQLLVSCYSTGAYQPGEWFVFSPDGGTSFQPVVSPMDVPVTESTLAWSSTVAANEQGRCYVVWSDNRFQSLGIQRRYLPGGRGIFCC